MVRPIRLADSCGVEGRQEGTGEVGSRDRDRGQEADQYELEEVIEKKETPSNTDEVKTAEETSAEIPEVKAAEENSVEPKAEEKKPVEEKSESSVPEAEKTNDDSKS